MQNLFILTAVEYLRYDIVIDLCRAQFKRRILHAPNLIPICIEWTQIVV